MISTNQRKTCVITGASQGIGLGIARRLDAEGYRLAMTIYNGDNGKNLKSEMSDFVSNDHLLIPCDVTDEQHVQAMFTQVKTEFGKLDSLVVNAGIHCREPSVESDAESWDRLFAVNTRGVMLCCREAALLMADHPGAIVVIGSVAAERPFSKRAGYCASKAAAHAYAQCIALEWAPRGIRVNVIAPGPIDTDFINGSVQTTDDREALMKRIPLGWIGTPKDVAAAAHYLLSEESSYMTGAVLRLDGGDIWY